MRKSEILYTAGVFLFGGLIAFGLIQGGSLGQVFATSKSYVQTALASRFGDEDVKGATKLAEASEGLTFDTLDKDKDPRSLPGKRIIADLKEMKITLFKDGIVEAEIPIISIGKENTAWQTPPGTYSINTKEETHFSSIGHVWMPFSMQFYGNFFIHGWPHYDDGTPVPKGFSGGCIRLATEDAEKVYRFASVGTEVHVIGDEEIAPIMVSSYKIRNQNKIPRLSAEAYLVGDLETGEIVFSKNASTVYPTASLAKLMTGIVSFEAINQYKEAYVSETAIKTYGDQGGLEAGERLEVRELNYALFLESSNDASEVLAEQIGRNQFMSLMNKKAQAIGLLNTHYDDPAGLSPETVSTAKDLFKLAKYINNYKSALFDITRLPQYEGKNHTWHNISRFVNDKNYIGGKNGYTDEAHHTLISLFKLPISEFSERQLAFILLNGDTSTKEQDMRNLVDFVQKNVTYNAQTVTKK
jgi:hypothetical protein